MFLILVIALGFVFGQIFGEPIILYIAVGFSLIMNILAYWHSDKIALSLSRAKEIKKRDNPELFRLVENLSITSGLQMPKVHIIDSPQINAFATGRNPKHASVAVTTGALQKLNRTELEGVMSHELSHIKNRDILVASIAVVLSGLIALLADLFLRMTIWGSFGNRNRGQGGALLIITGLVIAILAPIFALMIQFAVSRKREFLADTSGALLTRYPEGLASALEKIDHDSNMLRYASNATAHLFIANPFKGKRATSWITKLFSTHPPLEERVRILRGLKI